jgi:hypothetical protein
MFHKPVGTHVSVPRARYSTIRVCAALVAAAVSISACDVHGVSEPGSLTTLTISPTTQSLPINGTQQFTVVGKDAAGVDVTVSPTWTVAANGGTISSTGLFTAGTTVGSFPNTITATSGGVTARASITVVAGALTTIAVSPSPDTLTVGQTRQFTAAGRDAGGNTVPVTATWAVGAAGGGAISGTGLFTAGTVPGTYTNTVTASSGSTVGTATVVVRAGALASITVTPSPVTLAARGTQTFTAVGKDASGNVVPLTTTWSIASGGGAISSAGVFTAGDSVGTFTNTVRATSGSLSGSATVSVTAGAATTLLISPNPVTLATGAVQQFTVVARDAGMNIVPVSARWSVVGGGTIDSLTGRYTAGSVGGTFTNTVRATVGAIVGSATVVVTNALTTLTVSPNPAIVMVNGTQQFTATGRGSNGDTLVIAPTWSVVSGGGSIDSMTGRFTAGATTGTFTSTVRATSGAINAFATVQVTAPTAPRIATITVSPTPTAVLINGTRQFTSTARDSSGNVLTHTPVWSVVAGGGTINATTGVFTAGTLAGTYTSTVRATVDSVFGSATVEVQNAPTPALATITVSPNPASMLVNGTQTFTAVGRDASNNVVTFTPVWSVTNGGGVINATTGQFTAGATAGTYANTVRATSGSILGSATVTVLAATPAPLINLGSAAGSGIMAGSAVTCVTGGTISADVNVSPGNTITGFGPCVISGVQNLANATAANAQVSLTAAYNQLAALPCPPANAISADLGGTTKAAGVYCTATSIGVTGPLTLDGGGDPNATFVFQAGTSLITAGNIVLINGAQAKNVYWLVGSSATLGTASAWKGNIIALTSITLVDNATLIGRALARNGAVTLGTNNVITLP